MSSNAGWHADPTGRHELRWYDGTNWTDDVSDAGVVAVDPVPLGSVVAEQSGSALEPEVAPELASASDSGDPAGGAPVDGGVAPVPAQAGGDVGVAGPTIGRVPLIAGAALIVLAVAALLFLLGGDDDDKPTEDATPNEVADDSVPAATSGGPQPVVGGSLDVNDAVPLGGVSIYSIELEMGEVLRFRVEPTSVRSDLVVGFGLPREEARAAVVPFFEATADSQLFREFFVGEPAPASSAEVRDELLDRIYAGYTLAEPDGIRRSELVPFVDSSVAAAAEADWLVVPADGTYYLYISEFQGLAAEYRLRVETGPVVDLGNDDAVNAMGTGEFYEDAQFYTVRLPDSFFSDSPGADDGAADSPVADGDDVDDVDDAEGDSGG